MLTAKEFICCKRIYLLLLSFISVSMAHASEIKAHTYGNFDTAAGQSLIVNKDSAKTEVSGYRDDSEQAKYINRDHVGLYIGMYSPESQIKTGFGEITYSQNGFILPTRYDLLKVKVGMFVSANAIKRFSAKIISIDEKNRFIGVSGWFANNDISRGQIPTQGTPIIINAADKIWGQNTNVFINKTSSARTATGYELGLISDGSHNVPIWGYHAANLSGIGRPFDQAFRATGQWETGYYSSSEINTALMADEPKSYAIRVVNAKNERWNGTALFLDSNFNNSSSYIIKSAVHGATNFYVKSDGTMSNTRLEILKVTKSIALDRHGPSVILCENVVGIDVSLPSGDDLNGIVYEIKALATGDVAVRGSKDGNDILLNKVNGTYIKLIYDGDGWTKLFQSN